MFFQVLLVLLLALLMGRRRFVSVKDNAVRTEALIGDDNAWPKPPRLAANAFKNQFEFPVLFYLLTVLVLITKTADYLFVLLAWIFVVSRYIHAGIHVTSNRMPYRFYAFIVGVVILTVMWIVFIIRIASAG